MMVTKASTASPLVALYSFVGRLGKEDVVILEGERFAPDHPAVKKWPQSFGRADTSPAIETATAAPGEKRG
jgi:hypothetical protein